MEKASMKKEELLEAASRIVNKKGVRYLTLNNVAKEAGVSKGGLLYYFPTKDSLIQGGLQYMLSEYTREMEEVASHDQAPGNLLRAYIDVTVNDEQPLTSNLLAAIAINPELLKSSQEWYLRWQEKIEENGVDPVMATIIRLAADGVWFNELFGFSFLDETFRERVVEKLMELSEGGPFE
ncbi:transcriptional regulator, retr family [Bacillus sp. OxB-1]|uniref:TetR/AcrR family transcriptional regulator n=1 Tax=Bacillus sp. (strain OxB-1) TaxID=98228 RepID=UPI000581EDFA|nr:TetR/AcrR family transcriptional regulator [Bacillus sp. OxB-1]BAQ11644.1 transcriptional regulator, retr family [Bacillus sp. OxB-1]